MSSNISNSFFSPSMTTTENINFADFIPMDDHKDIQKITENLENLKNEDHATTTSITQDEKKVAQNQETQAKTLSKEEEQHRKALLKEKRRRDTILKISDQLTCPVCLERFNSPKALNLFIFFSKFNICNYSLFFFLILF